jgi:hypothetical protein
LEKELVENGKEHLNELLLICFFMDRRRGKAAKSDCFTGLFIMWVSI